MKKRYTEGQIIVFLREANAGLPIKEHAASTASVSPATTPGRPSSVA